MSESTAVAVNNSRMTEFVTITIAGQLFGIPTIQVQDAHDTPKVTPVPLAPREVAGVLNLRGKIVTVINLRERLNLAPVGSDETTMSIVVEHGGDLYSLVIDDVGDVLSLPDDQFEKCPATMDPLWREIAVGVYRLDGRLMIMTEVDRLLGFMKNYMH